ncbi:MAG: porin family protein [Alphaproteobacteria bacterium]|nr:MAG: porin family protein [Alphaproteobacteria bacterium]
MRRSLLCGVALLGAVQAHAADMGESFLRGSSVVAAPVGPRWDGFYLGAHVGYSVPGIDFVNNTGDIRTLAGLAAISNATVTPLGSQDSTSPHFGGFIGYNTQWDGAVIGVEGTYNWIGKALTAANGVTGNYVPGNPALAYSFAGAETARIIDYGTLRMRGGWAAGMFMPYATFGLAIGRMDIDRTVGVTASATAATPPGTVVPPPVAVTQSLVNQFGYGWAAGLGVDFCLLANLFVRAEYEYVQFPDVQGLNAHIHNVRLGAALKF